jgi:hypothetical protein
VKLTALSAAVLVVRGQHFDLEAHYSNPDVTLPMLYISTCNSSNLYARCAVL